MAFMGFSRASSVGRCPSRPSVVEFWMLHHFIFVRDGDCFQKIGKEGGAGIGFTEVGK